MPNYRAHAKVGPFKAGDVFQSNDEKYAKLAEAGDYFTVEGDAPAPAGGAATAPTAPASPAPATPPTAAPPA